MAAARAGGGTPTPAAGLLRPAARRGALPARLSCRTGPRGCPGRGEVEAGAASGAAAAGARGAAPRARARRPGTPGHDSAALAPQLAREGQSRNLFNNVSVASGPSCFSRYQLSRKIPLGFEEKFYPNTKSNLVGSSIQGTVSSAN